MYSHSGFATSNLRGSPGAETGRSGISGLQALGGLQNMSYMGMGGI